MLGEEREDPLGEMLVYVCGAYDTHDEKAWETELGWPIFRADAGS